MSRQKPLRVLVVCLGNICRSPAGEAALIEAAGEAGIELAVASAGTGEWHVGDGRHPQIVAAGRRAGLHIEGRARQIASPEELAGFDLIFVMDHSNLVAVESMAPELADRVHYFRAFDGTDQDEVEDPYGRADHAYDETVRVVRAAARGIVEAIVDGRLP